MASESASGVAHTIRPLRGLDEYRACVQLQEEIWGAGFSERVPVAMLKVCQRLGGVSSGAFDAEGRLIGFVFGTTGIEEGRPVHWSDMLAVRSGLRNSGLGVALKRHQRDLLLDLGVEIVYWTFDPLQSKNAWLNLMRLGAVSGEYAPDMYGETDSPLHAGIGTDRLVARWEIAGKRVARRLAGEESPLVDADLTSAGRALDVGGAAAAIGAASGHPRPGEPRLGLSERRVLITIPADIDALKARDPELARAWRSGTRAAFMHYLNEGYEVRELVRTGAVSRYVLDRVAK